MAEKILKARKEAQLLNYGWLGEKLDTELNSIVETLENEGTISPADFSRLVEFHRETCRTAEPPPPTVEWHDNLQPGETTCDN